MLSQKIESDNKQIQNKSNNPSQQQKEQQDQQIAEHTIATTATISKTTNEDTRRINENQKINKAILDKSTDITKFINNTSADNKYYNVAVLEQIKVFNKINQNMIDNAINNTRTIHELLTEYIEIFNKSIELGQQCYRDGIKNYFNFGKKI